MQLRDRRGPFAALLLAVAYVMVVATGLEMALAGLDWIERDPLPPGLVWLLWLNAAALAWRLAIRALFTAREFGMTQGLLAIPRVAISNAVSIIAARRALFAYVRSLRGAPAVWDKTEHSAHPASPAGGQAA